MNKKNPTIVFNVVATPSGNIFKYDMPDGFYQFQGVSLSGYYGELALPVSAHDSVSIIRNDKSLTEEPLAIWSRGYEGHVVYFNNLPDSLKPCVDEASNGTHMLSADLLEVGDSVQCSLQATDRNDRQGSIEYFDRRLDSDANIQNAAVKFIPK